MTARRKQKTPKRGALANLVRQPHPTAFGTVALVARIWQQRAQFVGHELDGLMNLVVLAASSHLEQFLVELIKYKLLLPLLVLQRKNVLPAQTIWQEALTIGPEPQVIPTNRVGANAERAVVDLVAEQQMLLRVVDSWLADIESAPFNSLRRSFEIATGIHLSEVLDAKTLQAVTGLYALRNVVVHGRDAFIVLEDGLPPTARVDGSPLAEVVKSLRESKVIKAGEQRQMTAFEIQGHVFSEVSVRFFYGMARTAEQTILSHPLFRTPGFGFPPALLPALV